MGNPSKQFEFIRLYPRLTSDPLTGKVGEIYYNLALNKLRICVDPTPIWSDIGYSAQAAFQDKNSVLINGGTWSHSFVPGTESILAENTSQPISGGGAPTPGTFVAAPFTVVNPTLISKISLIIRAVNPTSVLQTVTILKDNGGVPDINDVIAVSEPFDSSTLTSSFSLVDFIFTNTQVSSGSYWFYIEAKPDIAFEGRPVSSVQSTDGGLSWSSLTNFLSFEITEQGSPIPRISWDGVAYLSIPGLENSANAIAPAFFDLQDGEVVYADINRANTPSTLSLSKDFIQDVPFGEDTVILIRKIGSVYVVDDRFALSENESGSLDSSRTIFETQNKNLNVIGSSEIKFLPQSTEIQTSSEWINPSVSFASFGSSGTNKIGFKYEPISSTDVTSVTFALNGNVSLPVTGDVTLKIYDDNAGEPGSVIATSLPVSFSSYNNASPADFVFSLPTPYSLAGSSIYYFILEASVGFVNPTGLSILGTGSQVDISQSAITDLGSGWVTSALNIVGSIQSLVSLDPSIQVSSNLYLQVAGLPLTSNIIEAERYFIPAQSYLVLDINRSATPSIMPSEDVLAGDPIDLDSFVFAYNDGTYVWLWNGEKLEVGQTKVNGESVSKEVIAALGLADYKDKESQTRILSTDTPSASTLLTPANKIAIDGTRRSISSKNLDAKFDGVRINWQTGQILTYTGNTVLGTFTAPNTIISSGQSRWYSVSLKAATATVNNEIQFDVIIIPAASDSSTLKASYQSGAIQVGQVLVSNVAGTISPILQSHVIQNSAAGSGSGAGGFDLQGPLTLLDDQPTSQSLITLPLVETKFVEMTYSIERNGSFRVGKCLISTNGSIVAFSDQYTETGLSETILLASVVGPNLIIGYTTTFAGSNGSLKYSINNWV